MGGKGGVVAAAVLRVEHEADIQNVGLPEGVGGVGAEQREDVLRCGELRTGGMDEEGIPLLVVIGLIAVDGVEREGGDKLHTLPHHIGQTDVVGFVVIGCDGENAFGQGVHHILGGGLEDDVPDKVFWKRAVVGELGGKDGELRLRGKLTEEKQVKPKRFSRRAEPTRS